MSIFLVDGHPSYICGVNASSVSASRRQTKIEFAHLKYRKQYREYTYIYRSLISLRYAQIVNTILR